MGSSTLGKPRALCGPESGSINTSPVSYTHLNAIAEKQRLAAEEAIRADERAKFVQQYGQPGQGPMMPSKEPFIPRPREGTTGHPWERGSASEQRAQRIERAMKTQIQAVN